MGKKKNVRSNFKKTGGYLWGIFFVIRSGGKRPRSPKPGLRIISVTSVNRLQIVKRGGGGVFRNRFGMKAGN